LKGSLQLRNENATGEHNVQKQEKMNNRKNGNNNEELNDDKSINY